MHVATVLHQLCLLVMPTLFVWEGVRVTAVTKHSMCSQVRIGQQVPYSIIIKCSTVIQDGMIIRPSVLEGDLDLYLVAELDCMYLVELYMQNPVRLQG